MPNKSLGDYLTEIQDLGELIRIAAPVDSAKAAAMKSLGATFAEINRKNSRVMPFAANDATDKASAHRRGLVGQVLGQDVRDIRDLSTVDIQQAAKVLKEMYAN